jgi:hypothetical protein
VEWCRKNITVIDEQNPQRIVTRPLGVYKSRVCDATSLDVFFIALCRSFGIPARNEPVTRRLQYHSGDAWHNVDLTGTSTEELIPEQGSVSATFANPTALMPDPRSGGNFNIFRISEDGTLQGRYYRGTWSTLLKNPLQMETGTYMLLTGTRMASGSVLAHMEFFTVDKGENATTRLVMREDKNAISVIGSMDAEALYKPTDGDEEISILSTTGRGYFIVGILGAGQEPTNHAMKDIAAVAGQFEEWGRSIVLLFPDETGMKRFDANEFKGLPNTISYGIDTNNIAGTIARSLHLPNTSTLPIFVIADSFGRIVFVSQGYTIGIGNQMLNVIHKL